MIMAAFLIGSALALPLRPTPASRIFMTERARVVTTDIEETAAAVAGKINVDEATDDVSKLLLKEWFNKGMAERRFTRAADWLSMGESVSAVDVVCVLSRWREFAEWDEHGILPEMDAMFDGAGNVCDGPALQRAWVRWDAAHVDSLWASSIRLDRTTHLPPWKARGVKRPKADPFWGVPDVEAAGSQPWAARSPERRGWCVRFGQAQRWWHATNVAGGLPVRTDTAPLAASVGLTPEEIDQREVSPLACDIVFDALSRSQSGIVDKELVNERRACYETSDGAFDADAFAADLSAAKRATVVASAIFPGSLNLVMLVAYLQCDGVAKTMEAWDGMLETIMANVALWSRMLQGI